MASFQVRQKSPNHRRRARHRTRLSHGDRASVSPHDGNIVFQLVRAIGPGRFGIQSARVGHREPGENRERRRRLVADHDRHRHGSDALGIRADAGKEERVRLTRHASVAGGPSQQKSVNGKPTRPTDT